MEASGQLGQIDLSNSFGNYTALANGSRVAPDKQTFELSVVNTGMPIVEKSLYKWMMDISNGYIGYGKGIHMAIKFWNSSRVPMGGINKAPNFIYLFTNIYPLTIDTWNPKQTVDTNSITRKITFSFDEFLINPKKGVNLYGTDSKKSDTEKKLKLPTEYVTYKDGDKSGDTNVIQNNTQITPFVNNINTGDNIENSTILNINQKSLISTIDVNNTTKEQEELLSDI